MAAKRKRRQRKSTAPSSLQHALKKLTRMKAGPRRHAIEHSNDGFMRQLSSAVKSVRKKPLPANLQKRLAKHRAVLRVLASPSKSLGAKRKVASRQKGGFFGSLLASLVVPLIGNLVSGIAKSFVGGK